MLGERVNLKLKLPNIRRKMMLTCGISSWVAISESRVVRRFLGFEGFGGGDSIEQKEQYRWNKLDLLV